MYNILLKTHSHFRDSLLTLLIICFLLFLYAFIKKIEFKKYHTIFRIMGLSLAHIQFTIGFILYFTSPLVLSAWANITNILNTKDLFFIAILHPLMMLIAIVLLTVGTVVSKKKELDTQKFKTLVLSYSISLLLIGLSIPWYRFAK